PNNWRTKALADGNKISLSHRSADVPQVTYTWSHLGPTNYQIAGATDFGQGRSSVVWAHPTNLNFLFAGFADGGLWKTTNGGGNWSPLTDFEATTSIGSLDIQIGSDAANLTDAILYVGTGEGNTSGDSVDGAGVLKSTDGGGTWVLQTLPWANPDQQTGPRWRHSIRKIRIDSNVPNAQSVWVAGDGGVYHTTDGGANWSLVTELPYTGKPLVGGCWPELATDFVIDDTVNPSILYAAFGARSNSSSYPQLSCTGVANDPTYRRNNGIYRSMDGGANWIPISTGQFPAIPGNVGRITLMQAPSDKKQVYALISCVNNTTTCPYGPQYSSLGIYHTADASAANVTWSLGSTTNFCASQGWYDLTGAVDPTDPAKLFVAGLDVYLSINSGGAIAQKSHWTGSGTDLVHADQHYIFYANPTTVFISCDGGIYKGVISRSNVSWSNLNSGGLSTLQFYGIAQHPSTANRIHAGLQDNGEAYTATGATWFETYGGDGGFSATDQSNGNNAYEEYVYAAIARSVNGGASGWTCIQSFGGCSGCGGCVPDNQCAFIAPMELDANNQRGLYTGSKFVYRNSNAPASSTWTKISPDLVGTAYDYILNIHSAPNHGSPGILWATTLNGKVWVTTNSGSTWTDTTEPPLPNNPVLPNRAATWIVTHPQDGEQAIVVFSGWNGSGDQPGHVFRTPDGGVSWEDISGALPDEPVFTVTVDPAHPNDVYIGTEYGVYVNNSGWSGNTWTKINNGQLPNAHVHQLQFSRANGKLRVATHGRGIWELTEGCPAFTAPTLAAPAMAGCSVSLSWTPGAPTGAIYNVYRGAGSCPGSDFSLIASGLTSTNYSDATASSSQTYSYKITTAEAGNTCESAASACQQINIPANCPCTVPPAFDGVTSVTPGAGPNCALTPAWSAGTQNCGASAPLYNIYRGTTANFVPDASSRIATCASGINYVDEDSLAPNTSYYYVVRAEDDAGAGGGPCRGGNEDSNQAKRVGVTPIACLTCPSIALSPAALPDGIAGTPYSQTVTASGGTGPYSYTLASGALPTGLALNPSTGDITGTPFGSGAFDFSIQATDANGCSKTGAYTIHVTCAAVSLSPPTLPDGTQGTPYNQTVIAGGGAAPYTFAVSAGSLPAGLALDSSTGAITGTPTAVETAGFTITATDANGCAGSADYSINIVTSCLFCDDFEDGALAPDWTYVKPAWTESGGFLSGTPTGKKAIAIATPVFSGCQTCYEEAAIQTAGGTMNKIWMYGWYVDKKNTMELMVNEEGDKLILKQRIGGKVIAKNKGIVPGGIAPNVSYVIRVAFDGSLFAVSVNGTPLFTLTPVTSVPVGTVGFATKNTTGSFGYITVN
ncbi:MAG TPA: putative Ig domain-containing protein, partial [Acidobacteriota bacterium]|nr:putative Ig domain-containing protein [Acidobacteriota bacterium]